MDDLGFKDWRIRLGITLGILVFSMGLIALDKHVDEAWETVRFVLAVMLLAGAARDYLSKR